MNKYMKRIFMITYIKQTPSAVYLYESHNLSNFSTMGQTKEISLSAGTKTEFFLTTPTIIYLQYIVFET